MSLPAPSVCESIWPSPPAIIDEPAAAPLCNPGGAATVDEHGNLVLRPSPR